MDIKYFCPRWGSDQIHWDEFLLKVKKAGYDGVEYGIAREVPRADLQVLFNQARDLDLLIIAQHYDTYEGDFEQHRRKYAEWFEKIKPFRPFKVNSQTGKDFFTLEQNAELIGLAENHAEETGIEVLHETHRNKFAFAAHITKGYLNVIPFLKLTFDVSHWVNVAESYLEDQEEAIALAISRTEHIHARVGYPEGPQVTDPRIPAWQDSVNRHIAWWDRIADRKRKEAPDSLLTITPEFGPFPYMVHSPSTGLPVSSQWDINEYMLNLLKDRYAGNFPSQ
ncbi:MAG TPA: sugar phosphate isomerase/epimerase [Puia sp.]|jgi:sugar phosphate isomerase/epimerase